MDGLGSNGDNGAIDPDTSENTINRPSVEAKMFAAGPLEHRDRSIYEEMLNEGILTSHHELLGTDTRSLLRRVYSKSLLRLNSRLASLKVTHCDLDHLKLAISSNLLRSLSEHGAGKFKLGHKVVSTSTSSASFVSPSPSSMSPPIQYPTGVASIDRFFSKGGIPSNRIIEVIGSEGAGKTYLAISIAIENAYRGSRCLLIDTHNNIITKVLKERCGKYIASRFADDAFETSKIKADHIRKVVYDTANNITIQKIFSFNDLIDYLTKLFLDIDTGLTLPYNLIIIDDIYSLLMPLLDPDDVIGSTILLPSYADSILNTTLSAPSSLSTSNSIINTSGNSNLTRLTSIVHAASAQASRPVVYLDVLIACLTTILKRLIVRPPVSAWTTSLSAEVGNDARLPLRDNTTSIILINMVKGNTAASKPSSRDLNRKGSIAAKLYRQHSFKQQQQQQQWSMDCIPVTVNPSDIRCFPSPLWSELVDISLLLSKEPFHRHSNSNGHTSIKADVLVRPFYLSNQGYPNTATFTIHT